jgi:hypothetical protein
MIPNQVLRGVNTEGRYALVGYLVSMIYTKLYQDILLQPMMDEPHVKQLIRSSLIPLCRVPL